MAPRTHVSHGLVGWSPPVLERQRDEVPPRGRVAPTLPLNRAHRGQSIFARTGPLTRRVAAESAGDRSVNKDGLTCDCVTGRVIQPSLLPFACSRVSPVPSDDSLLNGNRQTGGSTVVSTIEIAEAIMPPNASRPDLALFTVFASRVQRLTANHSIFAAAMASTTWWANR